MTCHRPWVDFGSTRIPHLRRPGKALRRLAVQRPEPTRTSNVHTLSGFGVGLMLYGISERVAELYERAFACNEKAARARDSEEREFYLDMERRWLSLAHHRDLTERLTRIAQDIARRYKKSPSNV